ncbi:putative Ulp1 peptidase [Helianthus annuus]|uniref:Putative cysteine proteinases superfamily protein n=1 Tax=Helianthus annuus TaxID=4232 RepID=A0A251VJP8_HELAN|nr:NEDD8-specific protease 1 [Helianthus annuus]XP_022023888.1 NEDD8-specific protease 1 [Helianthus annuus]XP_035840466.1 NEDD8-specific protease 1 [Helianthus annuus]KAF5819316.1 putative Ulp1 peptidase [Helianthus annuus]KAJ0605477.1 putative Ulp1 peptidase [Helianthus annuus]KAJ0619491.1 putative Ulp1 peptidase [Helianthus annuus]
MPKSSADEKILSYNDVVLRQSDLTILNGPYYLNDRIIEFYFSYLSSSHPSEHILLVPPSITFWIMNCPDISSLNDFLQPLNLPSKQLIIFPVNNNDDVTAVEGGSHWSLLAFEKATNVFVHHDSYGGMNKNDAKRLYRTLVPYTGGSGSRYVECESSPQQVTGYDCGLYVLAIAKEICDWFDGNSTKNEDLWFAKVEERVTPERVSGLRVEILELITSLRGRK